MTIKSLSSSSLTNNVFYRSLLAGNAKAFYGAGYIAGGSKPADTADVDKFEFPSDSRTTLGTGLSSARYAMAGFQNGL